MPSRKRKSDLEQEIKELRRELSEARRLIQSDVHGNTTSNTHAGDELFDESDDEVNIARPSGNVRATVPLPHQEQFDGSRPWESFIFSFENIAAACGWNGKEKRFRLLACLRGDASDFAFQQLSPDVISDFDKLTAALRNRFGNRKTPASFVAQLETRRLGPKEAIADYAADIRKLTTFGYPTADAATIETISARHFLRGLGDNNMTSTVGMHEPKSLQEAREIAERYFSLREETSRSGYRPIRAVARGIFCGD